MTTSGGIFAPKEFADEIRWIANRGIAHDIGEKIWTTGERVFRFAFHTAEGVKFGTVSR